MFFKKSRQEADILPPPPPFPRLEVEKLEKPPKKIKKIKPKTKEKVKLKPKKERKQKIKIDTGLQFEKEILEVPKLPGKKPKKGFFEVLSLAKTLEKKEAKQRAKEEKKKRKKLEREKIIKEKRQREIKRRRLKEEKERIKKQKKEEKIKEEILKQEKKLMPKIKEQPKVKPAKKKFFEKMIKTKEKPILELEPIKIEKPHEIFQAEQEIEKAIEELKKPKKPLFKLFKHKKEKLPKHEIKLPKIPKKEVQELPKPEIEKPTDDVIAIKHKIHDTRNALMDFNLAKAKMIYIKIMRLYNNLSPEKQAKVYGQIRDLYEERKNAESLELKA